MAEQRKRLCLIDGSGYIYRAFYALPPMTRPSDGMPVNAVFGFTSMLMQFISENADNCVAVVFDSKRHNFRNDIYPQYKANRKEVPPDLVPQFPFIRDVVRAFNIASVEKEGYEADDLIASYTKKGVEEGYQVLCDYFDGKPTIDEQKRYYLWRIFVSLQWHNVAIVKHYRGEGKIHNFDFLMVADHFLNNAKEAKKGLLSL